ncbi:class I SAM-dependent methyltransferase [Microbacterium luteolum]|uniref:Class I SAM-dependent methyltransferase n=1 Tax=Microbacterium luteolum TaxID=69367 RepID=A0ABY7XV48_MICLT|nr:class I SAM-dependent methyltransferase [Microbacterium luteolum]WDM44929.1 class I SAM-dependent methyltransferase [Microbacterium luteolum]
MMTDSHARDRWDWEYTIHNGPPRPSLPIVDRVLEIAHPGERILYVGIGDGRNFLPLIAAGLDVVGCELSRVAMDRLTAEHPGVANRAFLGSFEDVFSDQEHFDGVVISRVLVHGDLGRTAAQLNRVRDMLRAGGFVATQWTAAGTDPWPGWTRAALDERANVHLTYADDRVHKVYLSFAGCVELLESADYEIERGPIAVDLPRTAVPGGIVRDWITIARSKR